MESWIIFVEVTSLHPWICETWDAEVSQNANDYQIFKLEVFLCISQVKHYSFLLISVLLLFELKRLN